MCVLLYEEFTRLHFLVSLNRWESDALRPFFFDCLALLVLTKSSSCFALSAFASVKADRKKLIPLRLGIMVVSAPCSRNRIIKSP